MLLAVVAWLSADQLGASPLSEGGFAETDVNTQSYSA
jgi:hypothetical protein